jgi:hypothetical protein
MRRMFAVDDRTVLFYDPNLPSDCDEIARIFWEQRGF